VGLRAVLDMIGAHTTRNLSTKAFLLTYLLTYLLTPWCRIVIEKLIVTQLVKNILLSYGTRRFITMFTKARRWTLS
jgi:hypothetical protein